MGALDDLIAEKKGSLDEMIAERKAKVTPAEKLTKLPASSSGVGARILADLGTNAWDATKGMRMFVGAAKPDTMTDKAALAAVDALPLSKTAGTIGTGAVAGGMGAGRALVGGEGVGGALKKGALEAGGAMGARLVPFGIGKVAASLSGPKWALDTLKAQISRGADKAANLKVLDGIMESVAKAKDGIARSRAIENGVRELEKIGEKYGLPNLGEWWKTYVADAGAKVLGKTVARIPVSPTAAKIAEGAGTGAAKTAASAAGTIEASGVPVGLAPPMAAAGLAERMGIGPSVSHGLRSLVHP